MATPQELEGISRLRGGIAFEFLAAILSIIGIILFIGGLAGIAIGAVLLIIAFIVAIMALIRLYGGFSRLEQYVPNMVLGKVGVILSIIPYLNFIGYILIGIALYFIGDKYGNGTLKTGGIITAIPFINFIGLIISYIGLGGINFASVPPSTSYPSPGTGPGSTSYGQPYSQSSPPGQPQGVSVYQVGQGVLRGNVANFTLYSSGQTRIERATLEGVDTYAVSVNPMFLNSGNNAISVNFSTIPSNLVQGGVYRIKLDLDNNTSVYVTVIYNP